jgi:hypothetical protein
MTKYATIGNDGRATAFYDSNINATIPSGAIEITDALWSEWITNTLGLTYQAGPPAALAPYAPPPPSKERLVAYARARSVAIEAGGISVNIGTLQAPQNVECATDAQAVSRLMLAVLDAQANPSDTVDYPFSSGVVTLSAAQVAAIYQAVTALYKAATNALAAVGTAIANGSITSFAQIDAYPWPANS